MKMHSQLFTLCCLILLASCAIDNVLAKNDMITQKIETTTQLTTAAIDQDLTSTQSIDYARNNPPENIAEMGDEMLFFQWTGYGPLAEDNNDNDPFCFTTFGEFIGEGPQMNSKLTFAGNGTSKNRLRQVLQLQIDDTIILLQEDDNCQNSVQIIGTGGNGILRSAYGSLQKRFFNAESNMNNFKNSERTIVLYGWIATNRDESLEHA